MTNLLNRESFVSDADYEAYLVQMGRCPKCLRLVENYEPPFGSFAPEIWATIRENGIDPGTNHKSSCSVLYSRRY